MHTKYQARLGMLLQDTGISGIHHWYLTDWELYSWYFINEILKTGIKRAIVNKSEQLSQLNHLNQAN